MDVMPAEDVIDIRRECIECERNLIGIHTTLVLAIPMRDNILDDCIPDDEGELAEMYEELSLFDNNIRNCMVKARTALAKLIDLARTHLLMNVEEGVDATFSRRLTRWETYTEEDLSDRLDQAIVDVSMFTREYSVYAKDKTVGKRNIAIARMHRVVRRTALAFALINSVHLGLAKTLKDMKSEVEVEEVEEEEDGTTTDASD